MLPKIVRSSFRPFYMPNLFDDDYLPSISGRTSSMPAVNIREDDKHYLLDLAVPGMDKKDLKIDISEDVLTISSESKSETSIEREEFKKKEIGRAHV